MAEINNTLSNTLLAGTSGDDSIRNGGYWDNNWYDKHNGGSNVTLVGGAGNDYLLSYGSKASIIGGDGNDVLENREEGDFSSVSGDAGDDRIINYGDTVTISGGKGSDTIWNNGGSNVTINGGAGNDSIDGGYTSNSSINADSGNDTIMNNGSDVTIIGGTGNDIIYNKDTDNYYGANVLFKYNSGDGKDTIYGFKANSTLSISGGSYSMKRSGDDLIVTVGKGKVSLIGAASLPSPNIVGKREYTSDQILVVTDKTSSPVTAKAVVEVINASKRTTAIKITGNNLNNVISGGTKSDTIYGGSGNDSILGNAGNDKIYGGFGNDTLNGGKGHDKISGGAGNDKILGGDGNDTLTGEAGNDSLRGGKGNDILTGGTGNDTLWGDAGADTFIYSSGDGNDIILGFDDNDTLTLDIEDFKASYNKKYGTVTLAFDEGSVKLKNSTATTFHINDDVYQISGSKFVKK